MVSTIGEHRERKRKDSQPSLRRKSHVSPLKTKNKVHDFTCFPSFKNHVWSPSCVPGAVLSSGNIRANKADTGPAFLGLLEFNRGSKTLLAVV